MKRWASQLCTARPGADCTLQSAEGDHGYTSSGDWSRYLRSIDQRFWFHMVPGVWTHEQVTLQDIEACKCWHLQKFLAWQVDKGTNMASWTRLGCACKKRFWLAIAHLGCSRLSAILSSVPLTIKGLSLRHKHGTIQLGQHCLLWRLKNQTAVSECVAWEVPEQPRNSYTSTYIWHLWLWESPKIWWRRRHCPSWSYSRLIDISAKDMAVLPTRLPSYEHGGFVSSNM